MKKEDIIKAYVRMRKIDNTIPDDVLDFMKRAAIKELEDWEYHDKPLEGFNTHRHKDNPKEQQFHDNFIKEYFGKYSRNSVDFLVFGANKKDVMNIPDGYLSPKERRIVISMAQWLGSPVGQGFLEGCGYKLENK